MYSRLIFPGFLTLYGFARGALDLIGYVDLIIAHHEAKTDTWLGKTMNILLEIALAPPAWTAVPLVLIGGAWIWWDLKHSKPAIHRDIRVGSEEKAHATDSVSAVLGRGPSFVSRLIGRILEPWSAPKAPAIYDISVLDFLAIGRQYKWDYEKSEGFLYLDIQDALLEGAANGLITVWGRRVSQQVFAAYPTSTPLTAIDKEFWSKGAQLVLPLQMNGEMGRKNGDVSALQNGDDRTRYLDLHLSKRQALRWMRTYGPRFHGAHRAARDKAQR